MTELAHGFSSFKGFADTPTEAMLKLTEKWQGKVATEKLTPVRYSNLAESDPLAGYLSEELSPPVANKSVDQSSTR
jgi:hypothetical protein